MHPLHLRWVAALAMAEAREFGAPAQEHHYLGHRNCVGENLQYLVREIARIACWRALFGSAAWQCQARDVGSSAGARPPGAAKALRAD
ncbi:MAG: hypothetical protein HS113_26595 [Verrucomicrobiales bacterium]|nr:hypothetical protein [Verrucomicrobiales bacterium]